MSTGVFVLLLVMLMPYYRKDFEAHAELEAIRVATSDTIAQIETLEKTAVLYNGEAEGLESEAARLMDKAAALEAQLNRSRKRVLEPTPQPKRLPAGEPKHLVIEAMDLIFVVDTTSSMRPALRELAYSLRSIVRVLERLVPSVRIGISAYKDRDTGLAPVTIMPLTNVDRHMHRITSFVETSAPRKSGVRPSKRTCISA